MKQIKINVAILCILSFHPHLHPVFDSQILVDHVKQSIQSAQQHASKLNRDVLAIQGMTSPKIKHLLNNLCSLKDAQYLEIGVFMGSTFVAALYNNTDLLHHAVSVDNWSEFGGPKHAFFKNTQTFLPQNSFNFFDKDCFKLDIKTVCKKPVDIYFYDGNHSSESQEKAFTYFNEILADTFIAIVDDWVWAEVQEGTRKAFKKLNYTILYECELPCRLQGSDVDLWWNGFYVAVISKNK